MKKKNKRKNIGVSTIGEEGEKGGKQYKYSKKNVTRYNMTSTRILMTAANQ